MSWISGVGDTLFGRLEGEDTLTLMGKAATAALEDAGLERRDIDGLLCGYSTAHPHLMLASVFSEYFGLAPGYCHTVQVGGGTGAAMTMLAHRLCDQSQCEHMLVVAGENRLSGQGSDKTVQTLAEVGHPDFETPFGPTIPVILAGKTIVVGSTKDLKPAILIWLRRILLRLIHIFSGFKVYHLKPPATVSSIKLILLKSLAMS